MALATELAAASEAAVPQGLAAFNRQCIACHQSGGKGMAGLAPALAGTLANVVAKEDGRRYVTRVLINGLSGRIVSQGQVFVGAMPAQLLMSDDELSAVANYLAQDLNGAAQSIFSSDDFVQARAATTTHKQLRELREQVLR
ncbi:MAG: cytochrome c [Betaproteobacteria bacterium]